MNLHSLIYERLPLGSELYRLSRVTERPGGMDGLSGMTLSFHKPNRLCKDKVAPPAVPPPPAPAGPAPPGELAGLLDRNLHPEPAQKLETMQLGPRWPAKASCIRRLTWCHQSAKLPLMDDFVFLTLSLHTSLS